MEFGMQFVHASNWLHIVAGAVLVYLVYRFTLWRRKRVEWKRWVREAKTKVYRARRD